MPEPPSVMSAQPPNMPPGLQRNATVAAVRVAMTANKLPQCNWIVLKGVIKQISQNITDAFNSKYYEDLEHVE